MSKGQKKAPRRAPDLRGPAKAGHYVRRNHQLAHRHQIELLVVQLHVGPDRDLAAERLLQIAEHRALLVAQRAGDVGIDPQHQALAVEVGADLFYLGEDLVADRRARLDDRASGAVRTRLGEHALETLFHPLARDDHQAEIGDLDALRRRPILPQLLLHRLEYLLPVLLLLHVDEVEDDDAAQVAQPDLPHDLLDRLEVRLEDRVLETARALLADIAAGVDVDGDERLGLVDDDRAAGLQPHLAAQCLVDLRLDAVLLEDGVLLLVQLHLWRQRRHDPLDQLEDAAMLGGVVDAEDRKSTRLNSSHGYISYAVFCLKKKKKTT